MNPEGESRLEQIRAKNTRKKQREMEREVGRNALCEEGAEIQSQKRKVIRVESEETQASVRKSLNVSRDEELRAKRDQHPTKAHVFV